MRRRKTKPGANTGGGTRAGSRPSLIRRIIERLRAQISAPSSGVVELNRDRSQPAARNAAVPPLDPLTIRQWLWGPGFHVPGNAEYVLRLVKPFALDRTMTMLDVAAGLGGPARAIYEAHGSHIIGLERDAELARRSGERSIAPGKNNHAPVMPIDPQTFELKTGRFDRILGRTATYMVQNKERFIRILISGLRQGGHLLLTDHVLDPEFTQRPELAMWSALQPYTPALWTVVQYIDCLNSLGCDIRITEDVTHELKLQIVFGWQNLAQTIDVKGLPQAHKHAVVNEAERWVKTIAALDLGVVKVFRFYALAGSSRPPQSSIKKIKA